MSENRRNVRDAVDAGWAALAEGSWAGARAAFEEALAAEESAEGHEGLSWAAWWLDDAEAVFAAREAAYRLYRRRGDAAPAARMATWLAADEVDFRGGSAVARGWLRRAHRLLDPLEPGPEHGWLAFHEGYLAHAGGDTGTAQELARTAAELGRELPVPDLEMLGLALEGAALVAAAEVEDGMRCLDEATAAALEGEAAIPISGAWACCFLVSACTAVLDYERASEWCDRIAAFADRYGSRYMLAFCRSEYGAVHVWRGQWPEAESLLTASAEDFARSRPAWSGSPVAGLAELRRRQGKLEEAAMLLDEAGDFAGAQLGRARLALDRGDAAEAVDLLERVLRHVPPDRRLERFPALELLVRACLAAGDVEAAAAAAAELREVAELAATSSLRAFADLADGRVAAGRGEHDRARTLLEDAVDRFAAAGAPYETAQARLELAATLAALDRPGAAGAESRAAHESLEELGAPVRADGDAEQLPGVTPREREVLALLAEGLTNRQIAERLVVSEHTVHRHVTSILRKLGLPSRSAAAARAVQAGLVH